MDYVDAGGRESKKNPSRYMYAVTQSGRLQNLCILWPSSHSRMCAVGATDDLRDGNVIKYVVKYATSAALPPTRRGSTFEFLIILRKRVRLAPANASCLVLCSRRERFE